MPSVPSTQTRLSRNTVDGVELFYRKAGAPNAPAILLPGPRAAQSAASEYSATGAQVHTRLRSPYTLSTRFTGGQNFAAATKGSGKAA